MSFVSYAPNLEDVLLHRVFGGQETGFYVDVGAFHPVIGSVTKSFYDRGWSGINVEPGSVFTELAKARPRDINLQMAVFDREGEIAFVEDDGDRGMSHIVMNEAGGQPARMVPCDTLQAIVDRHSRGRPVDFIKVDAEGAETAIVHGTDWRVLRPRVMLLEATRPWSSMLSNQDWEPALLQQGFVRVYFDGVNCFYVPEEEAVTLARHFQTPVNVLDRAEPHDVVVVRETLQTRQAEVAHLTAQAATERDSMRKALDEKATEASRLAAELTTLQSSLLGEQAKVARLSATYESQRAETERLSAERDETRVRLDETCAHAARLEADLSAALSEFEGKCAEATELRAEVTRLTGMVHTLAAQNAPPPSVSAGDIAAPPQARASLARRGALVAYRLMRPFVRPPLWRLRTFMTGGLMGHISHLSQRIDALGTTLQLRPIIEPPANNPPAAVQIQDDVAAGEMRRLAGEMERVLLTLALERTSEQMYSAALPAQKASPEPALSGNSLRDDAQPLSLDRLQHSSAAAVSEQI